jgi:polyisoprenoid-binding protein YceI
MRKLILAAGLSAALLAAPAFAALSKTPADTPTGTYALDKTHASVTWKVSHLGLSNYTARFAELDATLNWNAEDPTASTVSVTVNPASVRTDYPKTDKTDFDAKLATGDDWFNANVFPAITFTSTAVNLTGDDTGTVTGDLTLLGVTKPVTLDVTFNGGMKSPFSGKNVLGFSGTTTITRSEWGFATYVPTIGDSVEILIEAEFIAAD